MARNPGRWPGGHRRPCRGADDVQQEAVQLYGNAKQYAGQAWRSLFPEKVEICIAYGTEKET